MKYYLRGIGIGIMMTTIILMISFQQSGYKKMNDQEIITRAKELGMIKKQETDSKDPAEKAKSPYPSMDSLLENAKKEELKDQAENKDESTQENQKSDKDKDKDKDKIEEEPKTETENSILVKIKSGDCSETIASQLVESGLIEDAYNFNLFLSQHGYDVRLKPGEYTILPGTTMEEIALILTGRGN